jgi:hypothetical protein
MGSPNVSRSPEDEAEFMEFMEASSRHNARSLFHRLFPAEDVTRDGETIHARHKYAKHMEFFEAGAKYRERCFLAANRVGKTLGRRPTRFKTVCSDSAPNSVSVGLTTPICPLSCSFSASRRFTQTAAD